MGYAQEPHLSIAFRADRMDEPDPCNVQWRRELVAALVVSHQEGQPEALVPIHGNAGPSIAVQIWPIVHLQRCLVPSVSRTDSCMQLESRCLAGLLISILLKQNRQLMINHCNIDTCHFKNPLRPVSPIELENPHC